MHNRNQHTIITLLTAFLPWVIAILLGMSAGTLFHIYYPQPVAILDLSNHIGLITQILAILVGFLVVGVTLHLSAYGASEELSAQLAETEQLGDEIHNEFYAKHGANSKITRSADFRRFIMHYPKTDKLIFRTRKNRNQKEQHFIIRRYCDGVWYPTSYSPFAEEIHVSKLLCIQRVHEVVICAYKVVHLVHEVRQSGTWLLSSKRGSQGSTLFLEDLKKETHRLKGLESGSVPMDITLDTANQIVCLAVDSFHYMYEELRDHSEESGWQPHKLSHFLVLFTEYFVWINYFLGKLQLLRTAVINTRYPKFLATQKELLETKLALKKISTCLQKTSDIQRRAILKYGASRQLTNLKRTSIPGIGLSVLTLLLIMVLWPYIQSGGSDAARMLLFSVIYGTSIASVINSMIFIYHLIWGKSSR